MKSKFVQLARYFLPLLFTLYLGGITLFTRPHIVNGVVLVHSHVFNGEHEHTTIELETIFFLSHFLADSSLFFAPLFTPLVWVLLGVLGVVYRFVAPHLALRGTIQLRAPPAFSIPFLF